LSEIELIAQYFAPLANPAASFNLKDDAAFLRALPASGLVITADAVVSGVHFFSGDDPGAVAYKALAVNVSDLAAKGAKPLHYVLCLGLAEAPETAWAEAFAGGLAQAQARFGMDMLGGDTVTAGGSWWISITAFGEAGAGGTLPRSGAKPGDLLYLSGTLGDAALGLQLRLDGGLFPFLSEASRGHFLKRYLYPEPRLNLRRALPLCAHAAMDVSDGLALDLARLCEASGLGAEVSLAALPLSTGAQAVCEALPESWHIILSGGDDYEILAAVPADKGRLFERLAAEGQTRVTRIGRLLPKGDASIAPVTFLGPRGDVFTPQKPGFLHFATPPE
jgi:thiamine-monophosphate kinase